MSAAVALRSLLGVLLLIGPVWSADPPAVVGKSGMVVAAEPLAAEIGVDILRQGGNAVDAAVAVGFALAVTYPAAGNLGGGGFLVAVVSGEDGPETITLDFRETAPAAAHPRLYIDAADAGRPDAATLGPLAAGVPGSVAGMLHALERWGTMERSKVLAPAIRLARGGFALPKRTADFLAAKSIAEKMQQFPATAALFYPDGKPLAAGAPLVQTELAQTLDSIAMSGRDGFYKGTVAAAIVAEMKRAGGIITAEDLAGYKPIERTPIRFGYRGHTVISMPPPSSGGFCLQQTLTMLQYLSLSRYGHNSSASIHVISEALRRSFLDRNRYLGDPDGQELPLPRLLSRAHIEKSLSSMQLDKATPTSSLAAPAKGVDESEQTTHFAVVDRHRNAVAITTTLNGAFGCKALVKGAGFLLNNEMDDFATRPEQPNQYGLVQGEANLVRPGRRPLSSMSPTIVLDKKERVEHVLGTPGGPTIITNVLQVFLNLVTYGLAPQAAVNAPKFHHQSIPDRIDYEPEIPRDVLDNLRKRGHALRLRQRIGDFQLISVDIEGGTVHGATDPRGGGAAVGY
ncbi:MAG: gamma-glutamyltransferase [Planctomycetota bacterium]